MCGLLVAAWVYRTAKSFKLTQVRVAGMPGFPLLPNYMPREIELAGGFWRGRFFFRSDFPYRIDAASLAFKVGAHQHLAQNAR